MERLTIFDGEFWGHKRFLEPGGDTVGEFIDCVKELAERLASIEDILGDEYDLDRLRELVEADRDGRCVVLPCKIGDTVYSVLPLCGVNSHRIQKFERNSEGDFASSALMFPFSEFGKTVFRDKEAAEAALERMKSNG